MAGTAVFRIVVSNDSMKKAMAISHGSNRLLAACSGGVGSDMATLRHVLKEFQPSMILRRIPAEIGNGSARLSSGTEVRGAGIARPPQE